MARMWPWFAIWVFSATMVVTTSTGMTLAYMNHRTAASTRNQQQSQEQQMHHSNTRSNSNMPRSSVWKKKLCTEKKERLVDLQNASFHTISCKQYAVPNQWNPPAIQERARSRLSSGMWTTRKCKYTKTLVLQNQAVPVFKHLSCITVHYFSLLRSMALLCMTLLPLLRFAFIEL